MDQATLVKQDLNIGARVMEALSRTKIPVTLCTWVYLPELEEWQLVVATPWYDTKGPRDSYRAVVDALERADIYRQVPIRRIIVQSPDDLLIRTLQQEVKEQEEGFLHVLRAARPSNGQEYAVIFAPVASDGGALPVRRFSTLEDLVLFLDRSIGLKPSAIEKAIEEVKRSGTSSIHPVLLGARRAKRLGLA